MPLPPPPPLADQAPKASASSVLATWRTRREGGAGGRRAACFRLPHTSSPGSGGCPGAGCRRERIRRAVARPEAQGASAARVVPAAGGAASATPVSGDGGQAQTPERGGARGEEVERTTATCPRAPPSRNAKAKIRSENLRVSRRCGNGVQ